MPRTLPSDFRLWTYTDALSALFVPRWFARNRDFIDGDHWQRGQGWIGPQCDPETGNIGIEVLEKIRTFFTSSNVIREVVHRHRDAVTGHPIMWRVVPRRFMRRDEEPTESEQSVMHLLEGHLTRWWDAQDVQAELQSAAATLLWSGRGGVRIFVPQEFLTTVQGEVTVSGLTPTRDMDEALSRLRVEALAPDTAQVYTHPTTRAKVSIVKQRVGDRSVIELAFRSEDSLVYRTLTEDGGVRMVTLPLIYLPFIEGKLRDGPLITDQVVQNQRALNLALTMIPRSVVTSGFLERLMLNAQPPGTWEYDAAGNRTRFVPTEYTLGAGTTSWLQGSQYKNEVGETIVKDPSVEFREPVDPKPIMNAVGGHYSAILAETRQEHVLTNSEALMSGKSREQARAGFEASLRPTKVAVETMTALALEAALAHGELVTDADYLSDFRVVATCRVDVGPAAASEREQDKQGIETGAMSIETAMERAGVVDTDAERARINMDPMYQLKVLERQLEVLAKAAQAGVPVEAVASMMGLESKLVTAIKRAADEAAIDQVIDETRPQRTA